MSKKPLDIIGLDEKKMSYEQLFGVCVCSGLVGVLEMADYILNNKSLSLKIMILCEPNLPYEIRPIIIIVSTTKYKN